MISLILFCIFSFETTHNIVIYGVELAPTMKEAMKVWNMTVQWWMATYVYKKLPVKSSQARYVVLGVNVFKGRKWQTGRVWNFLI